MEQVDQQPTIDGDPNLAGAGEAEHTDDDLIGAQTTTAADGKKFVSVPLETIIGLRKGNRELTRKVKDLEPQAARAKEVDERLEQAAPIINAVLSNPKLRAEAIRASQGTRTTADHVEQPDNDPDAAATAEEFGFYLADGVTPDVARGQRVLARISKASERIADDRIRPLAQMTLSQRARTNVEAAMARTDRDGRPVATPESIQEIVARFKGADNLLANPDVVEMILENAAGRDRIMGRTPKEMDEPMYLATAGARTRQAPAMSAQERSTITRLGINEKDYLAAADRLEKSGGRAVALE